MNTPHKKVTVRCEPVFSNILLIVLNCSINCSKLFKFIWKFLPIFFEGFLKNTFKIHLVNVERHVLVLWNVVAIAVNKFRGETDVVSILFCTELIRCLEANFIIVKAYSVIWLLKKTRFFIVKHLYFRFVLRWTPDLSRSLYVKEIAIKATTLIVFDCQNHMRIA